MRSQTVICIRWKLSGRIEVFVNLGKVFTKYNNSELGMLSTISGYLFGNSLYVGQTTVNGQKFYTTLILPEALFNGMYVSGANQIYIYSSISSLFYLASNLNSLTQFTPSNYTVTTIPVSSYNATPTNQLSYNISKLIMSVSNVNIF